MNSMTIIAFAVGAVFLVATLCGIMAALNPPKEYLGANGEEKENGAGKV